MQLAFGWSWKVTDFLGNIRSIFQASGIRLFFSFFAEICIAHIFTSRWSWGLVLSKALRLYLQIEIVGQLSYFSWSKRRYFLKMEIKIDLWHQNLPPTRYNFFIFLSVVQGCCRGNYTVSVFLMASSLPPKKLDKTFECYFAWSFIISKHPAVLMPALVFANFRVES